jgi:hypothetical protein
MILAQATQVIEPGDQWFLHLCFFPRAVPVESQFPDISLLVVMA